MKLAYESADTDHQKQVIKNFGDCNDLTGLINRLDEHPIMRGGQGEIYRAQLRNVSLAKKVTEKSRLAVGVDFVSRSENIDEVESILVAVKVLREYEEMDLECQNRRIIRQIRAWANLLHHNVLPLLGYIHKFNPHSQLASLVSPWMPLGNARRYSEYRSIRERIQLLVGISSGLSYLHANSVIHGDLKGDNILIGGDIQPRLADFGLSKLVDEQNTESLQSNLGSIRWTARERFLDNPQSTFESDVWSLGMTAVELFTSAVPFSNLKDRQIYLHVYHGNLPLRPSSESTRTQRTYKGVGMNDDIWSVCLDCWKEDPEARPTSSMVENRIKEVSETYDKERFSLNTPLSQEDSGLSSTSSNLDNSDASSVDTSYTKSGRATRPPLRGRAFTCHGRMQSTTTFPLKIEEHGSTTGDFSTCPWLAKSENMRWFLSLHASSLMQSVPGDAYRDQQANQSLPRHAHSMDPSTRSIGDRAGLVIENLEVRQEPNITSQSSSIHELRVRSYDSYNPIDDPTLPDLVSSGLSSLESSRHASHSDSDYRPVLLPEFSACEGKSILESLEDVFEDDDDDLGEDNEQTGNLGSNTSGFDHRKDDTREMDWLLERDKRIWDIVDGSGLREEPT